MRPKTTKSPSLRVSSTTNVNMDHDHDGDGSNQYGIINVDDVDDDDYINNDNSTNNNKTPSTNERSKTTPKSSSKKTIKGAQKKISTISSSNNNNDSGVLTEARITDELTYDYEDGIPLRLLTNFAARDKRGVLRSIEDIESNDDLFFEGDILSDRSANPKKARVRLTRTTQWLFDHTENNRGLWIQTDAAYYQLLKPSKEYEPYYLPFLKRAEICLDVYDLLNENSKLSYQEVIDKLVKSNNNKFTEEDVIKEGRFLANHLPLQWHSTKFFKEMGKKLSQYVKKQRQQQNNAAPPAAAAAAAAAARSPSPPRPQPKKKKKNNNRKGNKKGASTTEDDDDDDDEGYDFDIKKSAQHTADDEELDEPVFNVENDDDFIHSSSSSNNNNGFDFDEEDDDDGSVSTPHRVIKKTKKKAPSTTPRKTAPNKKSASKAAAAAAAAVKTTPTNDKTTATPATPTPVKRSKEVKTPAAEPERDPLPACTLCGQQNANLTLLACSNYQAESKKRVSHEHPGPQSKICRRQYCQDCVENRLHLDFEEAAGDPHWKCAHCEKLEQI